MQVPFLASYLLFLLLASQLATASQEQKHFRSASSKNSNSPPVNRKLEAAGQAANNLPLSAQTNKTNLNQAQPQTPKVVVPDNKPTNGSSLASSVKDKLEAEASARNPAKRRIKGQEKQQPAKRQSGLVDPSVFVPSGRNEDPWFLDDGSNGAPQPYRFVYNIKGRDGLTEQYRQEVGDGKLLTGSYGYMLPDGIYRHVDYVADERGFRAYIRTSEPGTANQNPANVVISSSAPNQPNLASSSSFNPLDSIRSSVEYANDQARISAASNLIDNQPTRTNFNQDFNSINALRNLQNLNQFGRAQINPGQFQLSPASNARPDATPGIRQAQLWPSSLSTSSDQGALPIRPPGSIVNNQLRNFTSFSYGNNNLDPAWPTSWLPNTAWWLNRTLPSLKSELASPQPEPQQQQRPLLNSWFGATSTSPNPILSFDTKGSPDQLRHHHNHHHLSNLTLYQPSTDASRSLLDRMPSLADSIKRSSGGGANKLSYDLPLTARISDRNHSSDRKMDYDQGGSGLLTWLELDRARHLSQLERQFREKQGQLNLIPLIKSSPLEVQPDNQLTIIKTNQEQHNERLRQTQITRLDPLTGRLIFSKDQVSGTKSGSGFEHELQQPASTKSPQHHSNLNHWPPEPFRGGGLSGRLWAPYAETPIQLEPLRSSGSREQDTDAYRAGSTKGNLKGGHDQQQQQQLTSQEPNFQTTQNLEQEQRQTTQSYGMTSDEPEATRLSSQELSAASHSTSVPFNEISSQSPANSGSRKGEWTQPQVDNSLPRFARQPEQISSDIRSSLAMQDVRTMRNHIGLPQPPRMDAASKLNSIASFTDKLIDERLGRLDKLLAGSGRKQQQQQSRNQPTASEPTQETRRVSSNEIAPNNNKTQAGSGKLHSADKWNLTKQQQQQVADQSRFNSGPLVKLTISKSKLSKQQQAKENVFDPTSGFLSATFNATGEPNSALEGSSDFDVRRINKTATRLQTEKVSELEKFQQRLKTQQLLLEQQAKVHQPETTNKGIGQVGTGQQRAGNVSELNSHVRYDDTTSDVTSVGPVKANHESSPQTQSKRSTNSPPGEPGKPEARPGKLLGSVPLLKQPNVTSSGEQPVAGLASSANDRGSEMTNRTVGGDESNKAQPSANSINLDFINSVTALSVDQFNPFALNSANPAIERMAHQSQQSDYTNLSNLLTNHMGLATTNARYSNSPALMAAQQHADSSPSRVAALLAASAPQSGTMMNGHGPTQWASNHRFTGNDQSSAESAEHQSMVNRGRPVGSQRQSGIGKRFIEVIAPGASPFAYSRPDVTSGFRAFRDADLSIPVAVR